MEEEIFGPLLPIVPVTSIHQAIGFINSRPHPRALYVFAEDNKVVSDVLEQTTAGGVTWNGTLMRVTSQHVPFGESTRVAWAPTTARPGCGCSSTSSPR